MSSTDDGDEEVDAAGVATTIRQHNGTVKGTTAEEDMKGDSMLEDITDDDERAGEEQDLEDTSDDEPEMEVKPKDANEGSVTRCKDMKTSETNQPQLAADDTSVHSGHSAGHQAIAEEVEDNEEEHEEIYDEAANNEDDDEDDDEIDDDDDDVDDESLGDDEEGEAGPRHFDGDDQDVDDEFTSDSFCSGEKAPKSVVAALERHPNC
uniref:Uncharacterized protein n=1 Tax=Anopheles coluzzii TaxID=1518534 RepID=A0A8W7NZ70_ANOCL